MIVYDKYSFNTSREIDPVNGYLRVTMSNISKAQIRPYLGREIPEYERFNLDPNKIYNVLCPKEELEKAAKTFNNLPLTREHIEVDVDDVPKDKIVGSLGDHATVDGKYLKNNLIIYDKKDIDMVLSGKRKELSCGYRYTPVQESGEYEGQHYDFKMTDIIGNHVALVKQGRAGRDVMVADTSKGLLETIKEKIMAVFDSDIVEDKKEVEDSKEEAKQEKVGVVMKEFKEGELKSGSGKKVTDPKQAIAIALSEADKVAEDEIPEKQDEPKKAGEESALQQGEEEMAEEVKEEVKTEKKVETPAEEKPVEDACSKDAEIKEESKKEEEVVEDKEEKDLKGKEKEAFAKGVDYGEKKEKEEPKKLDSEHESEGAKKADKEEKEEKKEEKKEEMAKDSALVMDADALRAEGREQAMADFKCRDTARKAVKSIVGDVDIFAFDSAEEIYKFACKEAGMNLDEIASYKDAFAGLQAGKAGLAMDASPVSGSNDKECFKDIRLA